jgi:hypothetical protein
VGRRELTETASVFPHHLDRLSQHAGVDGATAFARASRHRLLVRSFGETAASELSHGPEF